MMVINDKKYSKEYLMQEPYEWANWIKYAH